MAEPCGFSFAARAAHSSQGEGQGRIVTADLGYRAAAFVVRQRDRKFGAFNAKGCFEIFESLTIAPEFRSVRAGEQFPADGPLRRVR